MMNQEDANKLTNMVKRTKLVGKVRRIDSQQLSIMSGTSASITASRAKYVRRSKYALISGLKHENLL